MGSSGEGPNNPPRRPSPAGRSTLGFLGALALGLCTPAIARTPDGETAPPTSSDGAPLLQGAVPSDHCTADSSGLIETAFVRTAGVVRLSGCYRASKTIIVPAGRILAGDGASFSNPLEQDATRIVCDPAISPCVQLGGGGNNGSTSLRNIVVTRSGGELRPGTIGVEALDGYNVSLVDVMSVGHDICFKALSHPGRGTGISLTGQRIYSGKCATTHLSIVSWPELRISDSRFGQNGAGDFNASSYVRIEGGVAGTAGGPNTVTFSNVQFNQGTNNTRHFIEFLNLAGGGVPAIDAGEIKIANSHIEAVAGSDFYSDSTWNSISRLSIVGSIFNTPSAKFTDLNAETSISEWNLIGNGIYATDFTLAPRINISAFFWAGGRITGMTSFLGTASSTATIVGVSHGGNANYRGTWGQLNSIGETFTAGYLDATQASGGINILNAMTRPMLEIMQTPSIISCGISPSIDSRSSDSGGRFTTGSGVISSCSIRYSKRYGTGAWPTVTPVGKYSKSYYLSDVNNTGFTLNFLENSPQQDYIYNVQGQ